ncbi:RagB/SusD family nutrient uptake outer membrane protein [Chitinophaga sp. 22321]|uniref:RagB/SusD family nutrient uptake outer membrane protein n=1 Tax=Chitinophaga hostae TaxID=2831022 RepID=A0ABS5IWH2_9BACT|nr:RagB/SusD family nutrient uptake outer membrane protein [Chitinophaga hostae]MBS0027319.1 RagB/SusD family nutrient uptake outer membrane protein [Chitinophaga hostae]
MSDNKFKRKGLAGIQALHRVIYYITCLLIIGGTACKKPFLDVVPDNVATIDNAFTSKTEAEKYLFSCYAYIPVNYDPTYNVGLSASDEVFVLDPTNNIRSTNVLRLNYGDQNTSNPISNYMTGDRDGVACYKAIRDCNIFLENVGNAGKVADLDIDTRNRWMAEVTFLKAYYHFIMFRAYGPIPVIDKNLPISASINEMYVKRQPVDSVVNYIAGLLDAAAVNLPLSIANIASESGRITKPAALSLKAKLLVTAASPLFNGNSDYGAFKNKDGAQLFNTAFSAAKWQRAADACKAAIDLCDAQGIRLYTFPAQTIPLSDTTMTQMSIRNSMSEPWNSELVWGSTSGVTWGCTFLQRCGIGQFDFTNAVASKTGGHPLLGPTIKMAKMFYTQNGVPIDEDKTLDFSNIAALRVATHAERFNIKEGETTARLNFDREPRYYADMGFDRGVWYMANSPSKSDENTFWLMARGSELSQSSPVPIAGFYMKKVVNWHMDWNTVTYPSYPYPEIRLADLYLLYAEALNEVQGPNATVYDYVNRIRARAGLKTVQSAWATYSRNPSKYTTKEGMRSIIQRERAIELCFEGHRYWDLLRWKTASQELSGNITGWVVNGRTAELYYREISFLSRHFVAPRDYLWPIKESDLLANPNLVQNPNW